MAILDCVLWPVLHYQSAYDFRTELWEAYQRVNQSFAERIAAEAGDGNLIWIHDYHLLLLPRLLRDLLDAQSKHCPIGFSLHTPFPAEVFWKGLAGTEKAPRWDACQRRYQLPYRRVQDKLYRRLCS